MDMQELVKNASQLLADAIARRDVAAIRELMAPGFVHRSHGGMAVDTDAFLQAIEHIPGTIIFVKLEHVEVDILPTGALVTGVQHAQVQVDGQIVDDRRGFVDWFVERGGQWLIQAAVDLPVTEDE